MTGIVLAGLAFASVIVTESAIAADFGPPPVTKAAAPPAHYWNGCYAGLQTGGIVLGGTGGGAGVGALAGGQLGCDYESDLVVLGLEGEVAWSNLSAQKDSVNPGSSSLANTKNPWDADIAVRTGFLFRNDVMTYLKIGLAFGSFNFNSVSSGFLGTTTTTGTTTMTGILIGPGLEYMISPQWFARTEIGFVLPNPKDVTMTCVPAAACAAPSSISTVSEFQFYGRVGISYKFM
jgi:outer membrane immunogenic protein